MIKGSLFSVFIFVRTYTFEMSQPIEISSSPEQIDIFSSPDLPIRTKSFFKKGGASRTAEDERQEVNRRIASKALKPHAGSSALSTRDQQVTGRSISYGPWEIQLVLIRERYYYDSELDRTDDAKTIWKRMFIGIY
jgi:hypothetical protein